MDVLQAKLRAPPVRSEYVERPRLTQLLEGGLGARLTLISAPAGFGKTALLGEWLRRAKQAFAWVSLDRDDNAWPRFLASLLTSLQGLEPTLAAGLLGALESPQLPPFDHFLSALPQSLAGIQAPFVLVLDDFHVLIDPQVHELLTYLIDNQPPGMRLVLAGRSDPPWPLARLRAAGALNEMRAADLRFTPDETASLLNDRLGLDLSPEDLSLLEKRTEGWVTGLHLAALSLKNTADRHGFLQAFAGSDRFVLDYLMEEVLARQSPDVADFLLQTSLLDRFSADLCNHVTGRSDGESMLRRLEAANLFVIPLDNERLWFTYHALMRSFLRAVQRQRDPAGAGTVHLRACAWFEARGDILDAIQHGLRAGADETIGRLIRSNGLALVFQGELTTVLAWLHDDRASWPKTGPWLRIAQLWAHSFSGDETTVSEELTQTRALVEQGLQALQHDPNSKAAADLCQGLAQLTAIGAQLAFMDGRHAEAAKLAQEAVDRLPPTDTTTRRYSYVIRGMALRQMGELSAAIEALAQADAPAGEGERIPAPARGLATLAAIQIWLGRLDEAEVACRRLIELHDDHLRRCGRRLPIAAFGYARLSEVCRQRNQLEEAVRLAQESRALADQWHQIDALYESYTHLARALQASGETDAALILLHRLEQSLRGRFPWLHAQTLLEEAQLCIAHSEDLVCFDRARSWAAAHPLPDDGRLVFRDHAQYLAHARLLLHEVSTDRSRARAGLELTRKVLRLLEPSGARGLVLEASTTCALFEAALGDSAGALDRILDCLHEAEPQGYVRLFLEGGGQMTALLAKVPASDPSLAYARRLVSASASHPAPRIAVGAPPIIEEPLSEREREVLRLLASTLSSAEIAEELCVATSTVRSHTKAIYGKLGVHTRLEAIDSARDLGLI